MEFGGEKPPIPEVTPPREAKEERRLAREFLDLSWEALQLVEEKMKDVFPGKDLESEVKRARVSTAVEKLIFARACEILGISEIAREAALKMEVSGDDEGFERG